MKRDLTTTDFPGWTKTRAAVYCHFGYGTHGRRINPERTPARWATKDGRWKIEANAFWVATEIETGRNFGFLTLARAKAAVEGEYAGDVLTAV